MHGEWLEKMRTVAIFHVMDGIQPAYYLLDDATPQRYS